MDNRKKWLMYDMHMHSYASSLTKPSGDKKRTKEMTASEFVDILISYGVEVFSITDHNTYDEKFYKEIKEYIVEKNIKIIDGVELDVYIDESNYFQMGAYFSPATNSNSIFVTINKLYENDNRPKLNEIITSLFSLKTKFILIPEGNKSRGICEIINKINDLETKIEINKYAMYKIFSAHDMKPTFDETGQNIWARDFFFHTEKAESIFKSKSKEEIGNIIENINKRINDSSFHLDKETEELYFYIEKYGSYFAYFSFSDWHNAEDYHPSLNNFIFGSIDTFFDSFEMAVLDPKSRIILTKDKEVPIPGNILSMVHFESGQVPNDIHFTPGLNVIVGKRGSGKSLLLSVIERLNKKNSEALNKYKTFNINNIRGMNYDEIPLREGELASIAVIEQDKISEVYENPDKALQIISSKFPRITEYDKSKLNSIVEITKKVSQFDTNYKSITATIKQIKKLDTFSYSIVNKLDFSVIDGLFTTAKNAIGRIKDEIEKTNINSRYIAAQFIAIKKNQTYYKKLYEFYNAIIENHNIRILKVNRGKSEFQRMMKELRDEIKSTTNVMIGNLAILLNYRKMKYLLENLTIDTPKIEKNFINKYMFVTTYKIPDNLSDILIEEIAKTISRTKGEATTIDLIKKYIDGKSNLKSIYSNLADEISKFVNTDLFKSKKEFFQVKNKQVQNMVIENYDNIAELIETRDLINLTNASLGMQSVAYLDMVFDLVESILLFDQPEDNIDNDYISNQLVPLIKAKKREKQLIFVTHNPSVAVYGDAFNYIFAYNDGHIRYENYVIENKKDKDEIMKILDGGKTSFANRNKKYGNILGEEEYGN
ncbi:MAG: AAA family ATPase [Candidatus Izemoplasmataceae bacterium]